MADEPGHQAVLVPAQPAVLLVGGKTFPIDEWPLAGSADEYRSVEVACSDDVLEIGPKRRAGLALATMTVLTLVAGALPGVLAAAFDEPPWVLVALTCAAAFAVLGAVVRSALTSLRWVRFDRRTNQLVIERRVGFRNRRRVVCAYPLACVRAVQLLHNGWHSITEPQGAGEQQNVSHRTFHGYELNLILEESSVPRLNLLSLSDWPWVRATGRQIGEFLRVPVIDKLYHGA